MNNTAKDLLKEPIYLIDGSSYIFRAYYAVAPLKTKAGFPTNALFGFTRMIIKLLNEAVSKHVVMVFDAGQKTFRNDLYSEYKANRDECPEDLRQQMPYFRDISKAMGLPLLELPGYEADDIIGTLVERLKALEHDVIIISGDKDLMQLVGPHVSIWDTMRDRRYGEAEVKEKMGVEPKQVVDFLGLTGDSSDNIPGLKGVGPKTAIQLIESYGSIENILSSAAEIKENKSIRSRKKISEQIETDPDIVALSKKLVTIDCDCPLTFEVSDSEVDFKSLTEVQLVEELSRSEPNNELLTGLVEKLEFTSLFKDLDLSPKERQNLDCSYQLVLEKDFKSFVEKLKSQKEFAFDLETNSLDVLEAEIVGFAFCWDNKEAFYVPVAHSNAKGQVTLDTVLEHCSELFGSSDIKKIGQNLKFDIGILERYEIEVKGIGFDTMLASYLLNPDKNSHGLSVLAREELSHIMIEYKDVVQADQSFADVALEQAKEYAAEDAHITWLLYLKLKEAIQQQGLDEVLYNIELPLMLILSKMERAGILLDSKFLSIFSEELAERLEQVQAELFSEAGCEFNINSPKQLSDVLYNKLAIPTKGLKKTKTGVSTDSSVLERLKHEYEVPRLVLEYRALHKLKSTYVDNLPGQVSTVTDRLHTKFNQTGTGTGRLSSSEPNLQNIPIQSEDGRRVRKAFIASPGNCLISADYSQIELRLLAHMSDDPNLIQAFTEDQDIHTATARDILNIPDSRNVSANERRIGKTINFGIIYGMSAYRLARELGLPFGVANEYIEDYFGHYAGVKSYFDTLENLAQEEGYVRTLFGRKRVITAVDSGSRDRGYLRRVAINAPIQGSAADIVKLAMIRVDSKLKEEGLLVKMLLQIHDELIFECEDVHREKALEVIANEMEAVTELKVPLKVEIAAGNSWYEVH